MATTVKKAPSALEMYFDEFRKNKNYLQLVDQKETDRELEVHGHSVENGVWSKLEMDVLRKDEPNELDGNHPEK